MNDNLGPPTLTGPHGRAWLYSPENVAAIAQGRVHSGVAGWLVEAAWAHPVWHSYHLCVFHLRPTPKMTDPIIYLPGATHEILLAALDPEWMPTGMTDNPVPHMLVPHNFAAQVIEPSDEAAAARLRRSVEEILTGALSPDTDFFQEWVKRWGDNMVRGRASAWN